MIFLRLLRISRDSGNVLRISRKTRGTFAKMALIPAVVLVGTMLVFAKNAPKASALASGSGASCGISYTFDAGDGQMNFTGGTYSPTLGALTCVWNTDPTIKSIDISAPVSAGTTAINMFAGQSGCSITGGGGTAAVGCLTSITGFQNLDMSNATSMGGMFSQQSFTSLDLRGLNTSNVTDMGLMFANDMALTSVNVSGFDTSNVTDMSSMFWGTGVSSLDLSSFNTAKLANAGSVDNMLGGMLNLRSLALGPNFVFPGNPGLNTNTGFKTWSNLGNGTAQNPQAKFVFGGATGQPWTSYNGATMADTYINTTLWDVNFNANGGSAVASQQVRIDGFATKPVDPTRAGYAFVWWSPYIYAVPSMFDFSKPISSDITLTAIWAPITTIKLGAQPDWQSMIKAGIDNVFGGLITSTSITDNGDGTFAVSLEQNGQSAGTVTFTRTGAFDNNTVGTYLIGWKLSGTSLANTEIFYSSINVVSDAVNPPPTPTPTPEPAPNPVPTPIVIAPPNTGFRE